ncbi:protein of unknown function [Pararobbsia alpina]
MPELTCVRWVTCAPNSSHRRRPRTWFYGVKGSGTPDRVRRAGALDTPRLCFQFPLARCVV